jgi:uncharacterized protein with HEPN domain
MSPRTWEERIRDILDAIAEIQGFTGEMDFENFQDDTRTIRAVELNFIIIGEAATQIPEEVEKAHPEIPWHLMRAMRNRLIHTYFSVDERLVWDTVQDQLTPLIAPLRATLNE